jgi:hypothetical protein
MNSAKAGLAGERIDIKDALERRAEIGKPVDDLLQNFNAFIRKEIVDHSELSVGFH